MSEVFYIDGGYIFALLAEAYCLWVATFWHTLKVKKQNAEQKHLQTMSPHDNGTTLF